MPAGVLKDRKASRLAAARGDRAALTRTLAAVRDHPEAG
jgi:hypothetical protein